MPDPRPVSQLVVIGASAGGIEALSGLVATLPADFPAPIVIAQHLDPSRVSHLQGILARATTLPVHLVTASEPLQPACIYVVPSNRDVEISDHHVGLGVDSPERPKPSVDLLLASAAETFGENLYAVILTGTGSDGADGARRVKEAGGTVIIQNPQTASFPGMPLSLAPTTVDIVADLPAIGSLLRDLLSGRYTPPSADDDRRMRALLEQLRARCGIDFASYRQPTIQRRLQRRMADTGQENIDEYLRYLRAHPEEYERLTSSFLIKVTDFFRDPDIYQYLRDRTVPELIEESADRDNELRFWSAGCATGEEAYSLAILVADLLGDRLGDFKIRIFATDVDGSAIGYARQGIYSASALKDVPPELVSRYFTVHDGAYEIKKFVRQLVVFAPHDLGHRAPFPRIDLTLCRNVLIYFTPELQRRALQLFAFSLRWGGRLILGKSETTGPLPEYFTLEQSQLKVYRRHGDRVPIPSAEIRERIPQLELLNATRTGLTPLDGGLARPRRALQQIGSHAETAEQILLGLPVGVVVVDRRYDIRAINAVARRLLSIHTSAIGEDLIHLARRAPADRLRSAVDRALAGQASVEQYDLESSATGATPARLIQISCSPQVSAESARPERVVLIVTETASTAPEPAPTEPESDFAQRRRQQQDLLERLRALPTETATRSELLAALDSAHQALAADLTEMTELAAHLRGLEEGRDELLTANQDLVAADAELRAQNEELLIANEEAQAAVEEVETLSEEQQASNEELETLNEELQATIEELNTANDDLAARGSELEQTADRLEAERSRLAAILTSMADGVLVVDGAGRVLLTNPVFEAMFGPTGVDLVARDDAGQPLPTEAGPVRRAAAGETFDLQFNLVTPNQTRHFEASGRPLTGQPSQGGVLLVRDITDRSLLRLQNDFLALATHELNTPLTAISGSLQVLLRLAERDDAGPRRRHFAEVGLTQIHRLAELVRELGDVVRLQEGKFRLQAERFDLAQMIRDTIELLEVQGQTIRLDADPAELQFDGDPTRLQQVVLNLLGNAAKHASESPVVDVRLRRDQTYAHLEVEDYGRGIAPAEVSRIFSRFYQVERRDTLTRGGLGLGLFIVQEIVRAHDGTIEVDSRQGRGTRFTVRLPLAES